MATKKNKQKAKKPFWEMDFLKHYLPTVVKARIARKDSFGVRMDSIFGITNSSIPINFFDTVSPSLMRLVIIRSSQPMKIATTIARAADEIISGTGRNDCRSSITLEETINNIKITIILVSHRFSDASESIMSKFNSIYMNIRGVNK